MRIETAQGALARRGFTDAATASRRVESWSQHQLTLLDVVVRAADPDLTLSTLDRLDDADPGLLDRLADRPRLAGHLVAVLGASVALGQHLVSHPELVEALDGPLTRTSAADLRTELLRSVGVDPGADVPVATDLVGDGLRLAYRAALLRIAARDLCAPEPIEAVDGVADELSDLADATLEAALSIARAKAGPEAAHTRLAVIALGKTGAQELNYVSDVDVLFVAEPARDADGEPLVPADRAVTLATRMAAEMTRICSAHTAAGTIWEVDAALRPEGKAGQLVRTLASHAKYYSTWAKTWEFQAMLKARPAAGDLGLGGEFVELVAPYVWRAAEREGFVHDTQAMRRRVVAHIPKRDAGRELKLGEGGLRDVEFAVQMLQLVHGRVDESLRVRATLEALKLLVDGGYVGREDGKTLALAYRFLRVLEHRIQLFRLRRTHVLPESEEDLRRIGRSLGYPDPVTELLSTWRNVASAVRRLHERLYYSPLLEAVARIPTGELRLTTRAAEDRLQALGYDDPAAALRHIAALSQGVSRQSGIQRQLLPAMLGWFADAPNPDAGLFAFRQVSEALGSSPWYLRALRDEGAMAERLARILASSRYAVSLLARAPQTVQMLAGEEQLRPRPLADVRSEMLAAARRQSSSAAAVEAIRAIRRRELFRIAAADLLGEIDVLQVGEALTDVTSATVHAALETLRADSEAQPVPRIAVVAMGRWGGREMSYASDADAMFVMADTIPGDGGADGGTVADPVKAGGAVITQLRKLLSRPGADPALSVDADLRPEGKGGALIRSLAAYRNYYSRWSSTWELQALVRADDLAGDEEVGAGLMAEIDRRRWPEDGLSHAQLVEIRKLKARVEAERLPRGADPERHTKLGPGGLADVEWTVQTLQLQHAHRLPQLRSTQTIVALRAARDAGIVDASDAGQLEEAWRLASRIRNSVMLMRGRASDSIPSDTRDLASLAELLGYGPGESSHLLADYRRVTRRARAVVNRVFWGEG
ncbi:bifunctional [glutamine synthetase] adenylyltransferase/[glutamine synthetase]-adenylyl-L-tyrosine phosphorylase [Microlunatus flavus]|uniref:Bifunctional glutamine synthetase adenylyltransferase/adenylyl-removing enzyme n=1 Tax=Microlunatus flavus TaxID=1036181 RepID=A0A1H9KIU2_9ACTN|nr:bifunctional [glutamine synthetase] adenylyltransferase/[glutamine synthetase]-adenylyl-L-tyrosine phosphorylase [Microlunatus flavus]SEQ98845.1 glutamate-ammonia-ligase adenylyltransferase [Microlunatus flavus]